MNISGFTFIRNGFALQYPFLESIQSILPVCTEFVVAVGDSNDGTREAILNLHSPKIKIIDTVWDDSLRKGGKILALQTNIALDAITGDWAFYIQGDEVVHERDLPTIVKAAERYDKDPGVDGLLFSWFHFFGSYDHIAKPHSRGVYPYEVRMIRNNKLVRSFRDAQGFRKYSSREEMNLGRIPQKLQAKKVDAHIYHYGKVRGPGAELERAKSFHRLWHDDDWIEQYAGEKKEFDYTCKFPLVRFEGTHPAVMKQRVEALNSEFIPDPHHIRIPLHYKIMNSLEAMTGWRPFEFRNYTVI